MSKTLSDIDTASLDDVASTVDSVMAQYPDKTGLVLNTLNDIQDIYRYLPEEALLRISENSGVPVKDLKHMGDFFDNLSLDPTGRYVIEVCDGTCCHIQGAPRLVDRFESVLGIKVGEVTEDGMLSLKTVNCVGACGIAPVVCSENRMYGCVKLTEVAGIVSSTLSVEDTMDSQDSETLLVVHNESAD